MMTFFKAKKQTYFAQWSLLLLLALAFPTQSALGNDGPANKDSSQGNKKPLPYKVDLSQSKHFREIISQGPSNCTQVTLATYGMTYELNALRGLSGRKNESTYPSYYLWNYLNEGTGVGTLKFDGIDILMTSGVPNYAQVAKNTSSSSRHYLDRLGNHSTRWLNGYDVYHQAMSNKVDNYYFIDGSTPEGLEKIKRWFAGHTTGTGKGGLVYFSAGNARTGRRSKEPGETSLPIVASFNRRSEHAMTFVGYNDKIKYDYNGDGKYTNDVDTNGDGKVDMKDWEVGALILANSYGSGWGRGGRAYVMYRTLAVNQTRKGGISGVGRVYVMKVKKKYSPLVTWKVKVKHSRRRHLRIKTGIASDPKATKPEHTIYYSAWANRGGYKPMAGSRGSSTMELGLDVTSLLGKVPAGKPAKFFVEFKSDDNRGEVISCELLDYTKGKKPKKTVALKKPLTLEKGKVTYVAAVKKAAYKPLKITTAGTLKAKVGSPLKVDLKATGGQGNYYWSLNNQYKMTDITGQTTPTITSGKFRSLSVDDAWAEAKLPFKFPFFGKNRQEMVVSSNGFLQFQNPLANGIMRLNKINSARADLSGGGRGLGTWFTANDKEATIRWYSGMTYGTSRNNRIDVTVKLYPSGVIEYYYNTKNSGSDVYFVSGINHDSQTVINHPISRSGDMPENFAYRLTPVEKQLNEIEISPEGVLSMTATKAGTMNVRVKVRDNRDIETVKVIKINVTK